MLHSLCILLGTTQVVWQLLSMILKMAGASSEEFYNEYQTQASSSQHQSPVSSSSVTSGHDSMTQTSRQADAGSRLNDDANSSSTSTVDGPTGSGSGTVDSDDEGSCAEPADAFDLDDMEAEDGRVVTLNPRVVALLPVLSAAAVELAHTALSCTRVMEQKVLKVPGVCVHVRRLNRLCHLLRHMVHDLYLSSTCRSA
jgi:hypothetical protein